MSDDLIKRLGIIARAEMSNYAERTVNEAADTIARQQEMLDRALESNGDMMVRIGKLEGALRRIADWHLPPSGRFYPNEDGSDSDRPAPYDSVFGWGSEGGKKAVRDIARAALAQGKGE